MSNFVGLAGEYLPALSTSLRLDNGDLPVYLGDDRQALLPPLSAKASSPGNLLSPHPVVDRLLHCDGGVDNVSYTTCGSGLNPQPHPELPGVRDPVPNRTAHGQFKAGRPWHTQEHGIVALKG